MYVFARLKYFCFVIFLFKVDVNFYAYDKYHLTLARPLQNIFICYVSKSKMEIKLGHFYCLLCFIYLFIHSPITNILVI